jgi:hypothetical protein
MTEHQCEVDDCNQPAPNWTFCRDHSHQLEKDLAEVPAYRDELETTLSRQTATGERSASKSAEKSLAFDYNGSEVLYVLRNTLVGWVRVAVEEDGAETPADDLDSLAAFLLSRLGWLRTHKAGAEAVEEIAYAVGQVRRVIDRPADLWFAGYCECQTALYIRPHAIGAVCKACGQEWAVEERLDHLRGMLEDRLGTPAEISGLSRNLFGEMVTTAMIRGYAYRGSIAGHGEIEERGRRVETYRMGDVWDAAAKASQTPDARRSAKRDARDAEERGVA